MSNFFKPLGVLAVCVLIFAGVRWLAQEDMPDFIQTRFYNPSVVKSYIIENARDAEIAQNHIYELQEKFQNILNEDAIRSSFQYNQSADDIFERSRIFGTLVETTNGLLSVQFVDANGTRLHYSTSLRDIISRTSASTSYRNYTEDPLALPYDVISVSANGAKKYVMDQQNDRIIFSFPFYDSMNVYHGTAVFSVSVRALAERLVAEGHYKASDNVSVVGSPPGILFGSPEIFKAEILKKVSEVWDNGVKDRITIDSEESGIKFSLISIRSDSGIFFGRLVYDSLFNISDSMMQLFILSLFLTLFLALYFILNFKPGPVTIVSNRLQRLRKTLFEQLHDEKSTQEKIRWLLELEQRRDEVHSELKYKLKLNRKNEKTIDKLIDKLWDELIAVISADSGHAALALKGADLSLISSEKAEKLDQEIEEPDPVETLEEIEELSEETEPVETLEEIEELSEETEPLETLEEIEELSEEAEPVETLEEIEELSEETEPLETLEEIEELSEETALDEASVDSSSKGLLSLASTVTFAEDEQADRLDAEKTAEPSSVKQEVSPTNGLLARAISENRLSDTDVSETNTVSGRRGLLGLASEIESDNLCPTPADPHDDEEVNEIIKIDIVSPFDAMFSSLDDEENSK